MAAKSGGPRTLTNTIKLLINAGAAKPAPPVGPALGQAGLNIMAFCKEFNAKTANFKDGTLLRVKMRVYSDKTYEWDLKTPPSTWLIKKAAGLVRASGTPGHEVAATISLKHLYEIGLVKQRDMPNVPLQSIVTSLLHTCRSMGVRVVPRPEDA
ncbi:54S ribosomal protein L11, mitochondrial [Pleodorina starrii]|uniref:Large ribosomal subunit protein uL11m n=1 Tax=Pleodorina starrii TaxID=330485 RepID=A0A9W6BLN3_9CHLO|nr:54S ribosomal protein L11 [Pleodorina starrii]GLC54273.1 54S ribosomal protein L11, mitochondrial [Pleodorina starrii]GLC64426.1 54S ribosomal protein L11 [Pleodorina starrii]